MSEVKVNKISPRSGTAVTLGDSGDTFTIPSGATLAIAGSVSGFTSAGIDDNATSVAITISSDEDVTFTEDILLGDSKKAIFGAGSDLQIYHDGSNSYVDDAGSGRLFLRGNDRVQIQKYTGEDMINCLADGAVNIYYDNAKKFETTSTGATITGNITATGNLTSLGIDDNADATAITIDSSENVGIGSASPSAQLHIVGSATTNQVKIENTDGGTASAPDLVLFRNSASPADADALGRIHFRGKTDTGAENNYAYMYATAADVSNGAESGNLFIGGLIAGADRGWINMNASEVVINEDSNDMDFRVEGNNETHSLFVEGSSGRVKMNTSSSSSPQPTLEVTSFGGTSPSVVFHGGTSTNSGSILIFRNGSGSEVGGVSMSNLNAGSSVSFNTSSDYRLKENIVEITDATTRLKQLKPKRFNFISDANITVDGFIAHEVSDIVPEAITKEKDAIQVWREEEELPEGVSVGDNKLDENGNTIPDYQGIDQSKLVPLLVKTIQELEARITTLEG